MMRKSHKRKKPPKDGGSWLVGIGTLLLGIAAICEVVFKIVVYLSGRYQSGVVSRKLTTPLNYHISLEVST